MNRWTKLTHRKSLAPRRGMTSIEVFCVVLAVGLGILVGFAFLNPELFPQLSRGESQVETDATFADGAVSSSPEAATDLVAAEIRQLKQELLAELRDQVATDDSSDLQPANNHVGRAEPQRSATPTQAASTDHQEMGRRTLEYWNQLNEIMLREEQMRKAPLGGLTAQNVRDFLGRRGKAGRFAAEMRKLSTDGVDPEVVGQASQIIAWYERGTQVNDTANFLVTKADGSARRGAAGQQWKQAEQDHNASVDDINRRGDEIRQRMIQKYGLAFPDLR